LSRQGIWTDDLEQRQLSFLLLEWSFSLSSLLATPNVSAIYNTQVLTRSYCILDLGHVFSHFTISFIMFFVSVHAHRSLPLLDDHSAALEVTHVAQNNALILKLLRRESRHQRPLPVTTGS
jgi:hypothetical protein